MKKTILLSWLVLLFISCGNNATLQPTQVVQSDATELPATQTPTAVPIDTATPTPIPIINPEKASQLIAMAVLNNHISHELDVEFSPDSLVLVTAGSISRENKESISFWNLDNFSVIKEIYQEQILNLSFFAFSPDGNYFSTIEDVGETKREHVVSVYKETEPGIVFARANADAWGTRKILWSHDGSMIVTAHINGYLQVFQFPTMDLIFHDLVHQAGINSIDFSSDGILLATAGVDKKVYIFDTTNWEIKYQINGTTSNVFDVQFSPDGSFLAIAEEKGVLIWGFETMALVDEFNPKFKTFALAYSKDGALLVTGGVDGFIRIWDMKTYEMLVELPRSKTPIQKLEFCLMAGGWYL